MISSHATSELEPQQQRWMNRYNEVHPYEESGRFYGCECGYAKDNPIHGGVARLDAEVRLPSYWARS